MSYTIQNPGSGLLAIHSPTHPESRVRSPGGARQKRAPEGWPKYPESGVRVGSPHGSRSRVQSPDFWPYSLKSPPRIQGPESGGAAAESPGARCPETRIQSPESTAGAEDRGADPQIPESGLGARPRQQRGGRGPRSRLWGAWGGGRRGAGPREAGREGVDSGVN